MATFDRRRTNPPASGTVAPTFSPQLAATIKNPLPTRTRNADEVRKIFLQTNLTPSAPGSAYLELAPSASPSTSTSTSTSAPASSPAPLRTARPSTLKLSCTVHGPRPLPRTAPYSATLQLSASVKFAPFASRVRRGYLRDGVERDLGAQLEAALRSCVIGARWPKSGAEVIVTVLESAEERTAGRAADKEGGGGGAAHAFGEGPFARMLVLAGCISVAGAALAGAGIDAVDLVSGGVAAIVRAPTGPPGAQRESERAGNDATVVLLDPDFTEHAPQDVVAACCVGYLRSRDEIASLWTVGEVPLGPVGSASGKATASAQAQATLWEQLLDGAVQAASLSGQVVRAAAMGEGA